MSEESALAEIYSTLNQLVNTYGLVMETFQSVIQDVQETRQEVAELRDLMRRETADAVSAANVWRSAAEAHKLEAERLRLQLDALRSGGC